MNTVELIGYYGSDETHALSAWTSTSRELTNEKRNRIDRLLKFLAANKHYTPFEKSTLHFLIECDTASHIHILKHRIGVSVNGESARYKEIKKCRYYIPADWPLELQDEYKEFCENAIDKYKSTLDKLTLILGKKRAKESARFYLPYGNQLTLDVSFNFRSFMHFIDLRYEENAQKEIRDIAEKMLTIVKELNVFKFSLEAFDAN